MIASGEARRRGRRQESAVGALSHSVDDARRLGHASVARIDRHGGAGPVRCRGGDRATTTRSRSSSCGASWQDVLPRRRDADRRAELGAPSRLGGGDRAPSRVRSSPRSTVTRSRKAASWRSPATCASRARARAFDCRSSVEGRMPSHGATQRLPRLVGRTRALRPAAERAARRGARGAKRWVS